MKASAIWLIDRCPFFVLYHYLQQNKIYPVIINVTASTRSKKESGRINTQVIPKPVQKNKRPHKRFIPSSQSRNVYGISYAVFFFSFPSFNMEVDYFTSSVTITVSAVPRSSAISSAFAAASAETSLPMKRFMKSGTISIIFVMAS